MQLKFTIHAVRRMEQRGVSMEEVVQCLMRPDKIDTKNGKIRFFKLRNNKATSLMYLVCILTEVECKIISAVVTNQVKRYI